MFDIRVICAPADAERITQVLNAVFDTGPVANYPTRDGKRHRLYVTADHRPVPEAWPTPEKAYALAPSIISEIGWTARSIAARECFTQMDRNYYLRKAALLDRIALLDEPDEPHGDATETAEEAALQLIEMDQAKTDPAVPARTVTNPRGYIRREYAAWRHQEIADSPNA